MSKIKISRIIFITVPLLIALSTLVTASGPTVPFAECHCSNLEELQRELRNAQRLQQAFRNKIPALQALSHERSVIELQQFAQTDARKGFEPPANPKGAGEVDYTAEGDRLYDPTHPPATKTNEELCRMTQSSELALQDAMKNAACDGIGKALQAHEEVHHKSCLRRGYVPFFKMNGAERAQDEVDAYGAQINALRAEIAQVLERSQLTVVSDLTTKTKVPQNPLYTTISVDNNAKIPTTRVSGTADRFRFEGQGTQMNTVGVDGNCTMTVPTFNLPAKVSVDTDGLTAEVSYETLGTMPGLGVRCKIPGAGEGFGMSIPMQLNAEKIPLTKMPLKDGAEVVFDMSQGEAAKILAGGGVSLTGKATVRIVCK